MKIGFLADIHEDINSLQNAFRILEEGKCDKVVCLGDIVGFAIPFYKNIFERNADACIKLIIENCSISVVGNHDLYAIRKVPINKAGYDYPENWYSLDYETRSALSRNKIWLYEDSEVPCTLSDESREYLNGLPEFTTTELGAKRTFVSHFCYPDFTGSHIHFPAQAFHLKKHFKFVSEYGCDISFSGHGHPEGCLLTNTEKISNPGFGIHKLTDDVSWIVAPPVARTSRKNGVMIFDSDSMQINLIPISS
jgi:predicted phosphodiesterase